MSPNAQNPPLDPGHLAQDFVKFSVEAGVLRFGEFKTKAGRLSPYFFNAGLFDDGAKLARLAEFYARRCGSASVRHDLRPRVQGITLRLPCMELRARPNVPYPTTERKQKITEKGAPLSARRWPGAFSSSTT